MADSSRLILQVTIVLAVARLLGILFQKMRQPRVVGEMTAGIVLGPSLLGSLAPNVYSLIFPASSLASLLAASQIGLVLFMFLVGLSLDVKEVRKNGHAAILISHVSIIIPFALASMLAVVLYHRLSDDRVDFVTFALFLGAAMSITAFPVLARILTEQNLLHTQVGVLTIACAAVDDVTGWCSLACIIVLVRTGQIHRPVWFTIGGACSFTLLMIVGVRRALQRLTRRLDSRGFLGDDQLALILFLLLSSALMTEYLGVHLLFGAFLMGSIMPKDSRLIHSIQDKFESLTVTLLVPLFFAATGLRTSIGLMSGVVMWAYCIVIVLVASAGKLGGCMIAARSLGASWRTAGAVGLLMNTRGLMELVILNIGLDIGVISPMLFSMMVLMALVTTFMTTPLLEWIYPAKIGAAGNETCGVEALQFNQDLTHVGARGCGEHRFFKAPGLR
jgi:Kef-type K+ transport system membrane component KefB